LNDLGGALCVLDTTKNAANLNLPIFVILPGDTDRTRRVRLGWVEDWDDEAALFLLLFGEVAPAYERVPIKMSHSHSPTMRQLGRQQ
jgi:hypothetical protein